MTELIIYLVGGVVSWLITKKVFPDMELPDDKSYAGFITGMFILPWIIIYRFIQVVLILSSWAGVICILVYLILSKIMKLCESKHNA